MPQIIVTADRTDGPDGPVTLRERINLSDFESERFAEHLVERLGWAVGDAHEAEQQESRSEQSDEASDQPPRDASVLTTAS